jgi:hypothetical protein
MAHELANDRMLKVCRRPTTEFVCLLFCSSAINIREFFHRAFLIRYVCHFSCAHHTIQISPWYISRSSLNFCLLLRISTYTRYMFCIISTYEILVRSVLRFSIHHAYFKLKFWKILTVSFYCIIDNVQLARSFSAEKKHSEVQLWSSWITCTSTLTL